MEKLNYNKIELKDYTSSIEAKSKYSALPNLHILVAKIGSGYVGLCLDINYMAFSDNKNKEKAFDEIFKDVCVTALNMFIYCYQDKKDKSLLFSSRLNKRDYWEKYDELHVKVKRDRLYSFLENGSLVEKAKENYEKVTESLNKGIHNIIEAAILLSVITKIIDLSESKKDNENMFNEALASVYTQ